MAVIKIRTICDAWDLRKLARPLKQLRLLCRSDPWKLSGTALLSAFQSSPRALNPLSRKVPFPHFSLHWRHNDHDGVSNHQPHGCLLNRLFRHTSKKTSKLSVTGLCAGNSPEAGEFPAQMASNAEDVSIWWRHHGHRNRRTTMLQHCSLWVPQRSNDMGVSTGAWRSLKWWSF